MTEIYLTKIKNFLARWWKWIAGAVLLLAALSAGRRAKARVDRLRTVHVDNLEEEITEGWDSIEVDTDEFRAATERAEEVKENGQKQLDKMAGVDRSGADLISDWNASNRLSDD